MAGRSRPAYHEDMTQTATERPARVARAIRESLWASRREGVSSQITNGILDYYLIPYALFLGATSQQIGFLVALPNLLSAVSQFFVVDVLRAVKGRRRLVVWGVAAQIVALAPLAALCASPFRGRFETLLAIVSAFRVIGAVMGPAWGSLMSDHLPEDQRGDYFGRRSQLIGVAGMLSTATCGALLYVLKPVSQTLAFVVLFGAAFAARALSLRYMRKMADLPDHPHVRERYDWGAFRRKLHQSNFARFIGYVAAVTFAAQLSAAYFSVHMLRDLHFDYARYTAVQLASAIAGFATFPMWGRHADVVGNARVLKLAGLMLPLIAVFWCLTEKWWGLFLIESFGGYAWAGFNLCATNFVYDTVPAEKRVKALGYYNLINGAAVFLGASTGGWLSDRLPALIGWPLHSLFLISAAVRLAAELLLQRGFREPRHAARGVHAGALFFSVVGLRPLVGEKSEAEWDIPASFAKE